MRKKQDIRTLCYSCGAEYLYVGYRLKSVGAKYKESCDRCRVRMGWTYILIPPQK